MKKNTLLALMLAFALVVFGGMTAYAESGSDSGSNSGSDDGDMSSDDNGDDNSQDTSDDSSDDSSSQDESDDSGNDSESDMEDMMDDHGGMRPDNRPATIFFNKLEDHSTVLDALKERGNPSEAGERMREMHRDHSGEGVHEARLRIRQNFSVAINNFRDNFIPRLESRIQKMHDAGVDTSAMTASIEDAKTALDQVETDYEAFKSLFEDETATKDSVQAAATDLKNSLMEVRKTLVSVVEALRGVSSSQVEA